MSDHGLLFFFHWHSWPGSKAMVVQAVMGLAISKTPCSHRITLHRGSKQEWQLVLCNVRREIVLTAHSMNSQSRAWRDASVGKMLAMQTWEPEFKSSETTWKVGIALCPFNPRAGEVETGSPGLAASKVSRIGDLYPGFSERPCLEK